MNPFKKDGYMQAIASINSIYIDEFLAVDIFSPKLIISEINSRRNELNINNNIPNHELLFEFNHLLAKHDKLALEIAKKYAKNLAKVLTTLKKPSKLSITNRKNWQQIHWDYWKSISKIYLVGGLTSVELNSIFREYITKEIALNNIENFEVDIVENSANYGTLGLIHRTSNGEALIFDFGQSFIKRRTISKVLNNLSVNTVLKSKISKYLQHKGYSKCDMKASANTLHKYIVEVIVDTINETKFSGNDIYISIANYIYQGIIYDSRGGYAKLSYMADNYQKYLEVAVSEVLKKDIKIHLYHDTSSMAFMFNKNSKEAVISLGTGFGISFLD